ncbi:MAG: uroporphyrinogen-III decarboxylase-like protein [Armatimonadetes bacterium]|nr:uroporphyrinogen-III decarboxylase-like protein [Armatimonadota bacterium]
MTFARQPDFEQFLKVLTRRGRPAHLPFYEHLASSGFIARRTGVDLDRLAGHPDYWRVYVDFWLGMGYDGVPLEIGLRCPLPAAEHAPGTVSSHSEERVCIRSWADFEAYPWPAASAPIDFEPFDIVAKLLPDGARIVGGVGAGPYEWASYMLGVAGMAVLLYDEPELVAAVFAKLGSLHLAAVEHLAQMDAVGALRQGDDLGFKTATFLRPEDLRRLIFPIYRRMAAAAHAQDKPFILHSCGNLDLVYDDLADCGIDAKHSFEDTILPVEEFKARYGHRMTPLGGLDVDVICRSDEATLRRYARRKIEQCFGDGYWALGTGNSLTNYMPVESYLVILEEGMRAS